MENYKETQGKVFIVTVIVLVALILRGEKNGQDGGQLP